MLYRIEYHKKRLLTSTKRGGDILKGIKILGTGNYLPKRVATNEDFSKIVDTSDEWITSRTGIKERRIASGEPVWYMGAKAALDALTNASLDVGEIDLILHTSVTPDFYTPSMACMVQREIGAINAVSIDVNCACSGFVYALDMAMKYLQDDNYKNILIVSSEKLSKITDYDDRGTCVLFGDAAAACVLSSGAGLFSSHLGAKVEDADKLFARTITDENPFSADNDQQKYDNFADSNGQYIYMDGREVYKFAIKAIPAAIKGACDKAGIDVSTIDMIVPHQANVRIMETAASNLGIGIEKFYMNLERYGNTSSASVPLCLDEFIKEGGLKEGMRICVVGFGGGLTYGAAVFDY